MNYIKNKRNSESETKQRNWHRARVVGLQQPVDGYTKEERVLEKLLTDNTITSLYNKLPTARMKFIVAAHFELGYPQQVVAEILGVKQPTILDEIQLIRRILLGHPYKPYKKKKAEIKKEDLFKVLIALQG